MGSQTLSSPKGSSEIDMEIVLLAMKPKGNKRRLFFLNYFFLHGAGAEQISFSLVRKYLTVSANNTKDQTGT